MGTTIGLAFLKLRLSIIGVKLASMSFVRLGAPKPFVEKLELTSYGNHNWLKEQEN